MAKTIDHCDNEGRYFTCPFCNTVHFTEVIRCSDCGRAILCEVIEANIYRCHLIDQPEAPANNNIEIKEAS